MDRTTQEYRLLREQQFRRSSEMVEKDAQWRERMDVIDAAIERGQHSGFRVCRLRHQNVPTGCRGIF